MYTKVKERGTRANISPDIMHLFALEKKCWNIKYDKSAKLPLRHVLESFRLHWVPTWLTAFICRHLLIIQIRSSARFSSAISTGSIKSYFLCILFKSLAVLEAGMRFKSIASRHPWPSDTVHFNCIKQLPSNISLTALPCNYTLVIQKFST